MRGPKRDTLTMGSLCITSDRKKKKISIGKQATQPVSTKLPGQYSLCQKCVTRRIVIKNIFKKVNTNRNCGLCR